LEEAMNRVFVSSLLASAFATGCVADEGDNSYVIVNNLAPEIDEMTGAAVFTPSEEGPFISSGLAFTILPTTQFPALEVGSMVESRIEAPEGKDSLRTIFIMGGNIEIEISDITVVNDGIVQRLGTPETVQYSLPFSGSVRPGGLSAVVYSLLPPEIIATIRAKFDAEGVPPDNTGLITVNTTTTLFGDYYGERIDSLPFRFPATVIHGSPPVAP
jgi:hypothetical protein